MSSRLVAGSVFRAGTVVWADFGATNGREQSGHRPAIVFVSDDFVDVVHEFTILIPCTRTDRGWNNHILLTGQTGLVTPTFAMTEQPRTIRTSRIERVLGRVDSTCLEIISRWMQVWLPEPARAH
ncbi:MAG: type II toxin-antitoxin system PemK/MazF family toxin [Actinomycetota bacterium]|nr:type II toxin-antitoxin system PemK/MazF family toxin [Actinomycetota bacterium]